MNGEHLRRAMAQDATDIELEVAGVRFQLVRIPPGQFEMGSPEAEIGHQANEPLKRVRITKSYYLGRYEVTQGQYEAVMGINPSPVQGESLAVDQIQYLQAIEFCKRLSSLAGFVVTLPTEAQWEYACRAGTRTRFSSGDTDADLDRVGWYRDNSSGRIHPVGQKQPNAWGLYDMHGNVWELCLDFIRNPDSKPEDDPQGAMPGGFGGMRGGGWMVEAESCRSARRSVSNAMFGGAGIRIALIP
jgi:formylglycine-generating enzyme required for sulfatase activity